MDRLEHEIFWRARPDLPLPERIYRFAEGLLALKELEYLGSTASGPLPGRIEALIDAVLQDLESRHGAAPNQATVPERVKSLRQSAIKQLEEIAEGDPARGQMENDLDDLVLAVQLFSYPGDYVSQQPSVERLAETIDKFEEDVLDAATATIRGARTAVVSFGEPIPVEPGGNRKEAGPALTRLLEERVLGLLDEIPPPKNRNINDPPPKNRNINDPQPMEPDAS